MADRDIYCIECNTYLGTIRDAVLKKGIVYFCSSCYGVPEEPAYRSSGKSKEEMDNTVDYLMNMFGMRGKR